MEADHLPKNDSDVPHSFLSLERSHAPLHARSFAPTGHASLTGHASSTEAGPVAVVVGDIDLYTRTSEILYLYALPVVAALGFFGNLMNLLVLTGKRTQHSLRSTERAANSGLIALAVSDLAFCVTAFPSTFLPADMTFDGEPGFMALYGCYCAAVISIFIMTSTWLTVAMSAERYLAICHPLGSRRIISLDRTRFVIVAVNVLSALFNVPLFWRYVIVTKEVEEGCCDIGDVDLSTGESKLAEEVGAASGSGFYSNERGQEGNLSLAFATLYRVVSSQIDARLAALPSKKTLVRARVPASDSFEHAYRLAWATFGNFIPLLILIFCNVGLLREIQKSYALRRHMNRSVKKKKGVGSVDAESSQRITVTLVCIVVVFLVLVAPSEIVKHLAALSGEDLESNYHFKTIEVVTNFMQAVNFSANFILYCIVNPSFRRTMKEMLLPRSTNNQNSLTNNYNANCNLNYSRQPSVSSSRAVNAHFRWLGGRSSACRNHVAMGSLIGRAESVGRQGSTPAAKACPPAGFSEA